MGFPVHDDDEEVRQAVEFGRTCSPAANSETNSMLNERVNDFEPVRSPKMDNTSTSPRFGYFFDNEMGETDNNLIILNTRTNHYN